jgi:hypothetical protein
MPADGIPRCHSPRTETSARLVSKAALKQDPTPAQKTFILARMSHRQSGQNQWHRCPLMGQNSEVGGRYRDVRFTSESRLKSDIAACPKGANFGLMHRSKGGSWRSYLDRWLDRQMAGGPGPWRFIPARRWKRRSPHHRVLEGPLACSLRWRSKCSGRSRTRSPPC